MAKRIRLVVTDCDGTLTDGSIEYHSNGVVSRRFSAVDGKGFALLKAADLSVIILTGSESPDIVDRAKWLGVLLKQNCGDKASFVAHMAHSAPRELNEVAYFGDDVNDLEAMKLCGLVGCPPSAHWSVRQYIEDTAGWCVPGAKAGHNAFRLFAEFVIDWNKWIDS